jgi:acyl carrier protein
MRIHHAEGAYLTDRVSALIYEQTGKYVGDRDVLADSLDSLDLQDVRLVIEAWYCLEVTDADAQGWRTVQDIARWLAQEGVR